MARSGWGWLAVVLAACGDGGDDAPRDLSTVQIPAEGALPEGSWSGAVATLCDGEDEAESSYEVTVTDDRLFRDFSDGEFFGASQDAFVYTEEGRADWLGLDGSTIGACTAVGGVFACATFETQAVQEQRTLTFFEDHLHWQAATTLEGISCMATGDLIAQ